LIALQKIIDLLFWPFERLAPGWGLAFATLLITVFALILYKYLTDQAGIKTAKEKIKAHFVEVWLYIDDPVLILKAQAGIFANGGKYLAYALVPLAVMFVPVTVFLINCEYRYHYRPFKQGETFLVKVRLNSGLQDWRNAIVLTSKNGIEPDAPSLQIQGTDEKGNDFKEIDYRLKVAGESDSFVRSIQILYKAENPVNYSYIFTSPGPLVRINPMESPRNWDNFWHPGYVGAHPDYIQKIEIAYPETDMDFFGWKTWWVWPMIILMFVFAFALKPVIKVEF
jgi:hypothetical protein